MSSETFTAGIEHGGLTTNHEIRMLICWLLYKVQTPVSMPLINEALQRDALVNYFALTRGVSDLLASGHLVEEEHPENASAPLSLTQLGIDTATTFERDIPLNVREKSLAALRAVLLRHRAERENTAEVTPTPDGCRLTLQIADVKSDLLDLSMYVPSVDLGDRMRDTFLDDPSALYRLIVEYLSGKAL
jgi:hypothetical protein